MDMTPEDIKEFERVPVESELNRLARQLAEERADISTIATREANLLAGIQASPEWELYEQASAAKKAAETLAKQTYESIRENLIRLYDITKEKSSHPAGGVSLKKKYVISDEDAAIQWCKDHKMEHLFVTKITNAKDFCEIVAKMPDTDFAEIQEVPQASVKTDLSAFLSDPNDEPKDEPNDEPNDEPEIPF